MNPVKHVIQTIKWKFQWVPILWSPFVFPKFSWYFGKVTCGVPYFLPSKWKKYTEKDIINEWKKFQIELKEHTEKFWNKECSLTPEQFIAGYNGQSFQSFRNHRIGKERRIPKKFGFDIISWGWKTKYDDYRHEWNPGLSIVFFNRQLSLMIHPFHKNHPCMDDQYWEGFLWWGDSKNPKHYGHKPSIEERLRWIQEQDSCTLGHKEPGDKEYTWTNYYYDILKKKYHKYITKPITRKGD